jgi:hypothetical protein
MLWYMNILKNYNIAFKIICFSQGHESLCGRGSIHPTSIIYEDFKMPIFFHSYLFQMLPGNSVKFMLLCGVEFTVGNFT